MSANYMSNTSETEDSDCVKLDVGGIVYKTSKGTLTKGDHMLSAMFSGRMPVIKDRNGSVFIDRSGKHFDAILNFLRDGSVPLPENKRELAELKVEAEYYCIKELALSISNIIEQDLKQRLKITQPTQNEAIHEWINNYLTTQPNGEPDKDFIRMLTTVVVESTISGNGRASMAFCS